MAQPLPIASAARRSYSFAAMRAPSFLPMISLGLVAGCSAPGGPPPSLAPRAAEAIDPRVPVVRPMNDRPVDAALARRLADLVRQAHSGDSAFRGQVEAAQRLAAAAGPKQSESWIVAQEALSGAIEAREPTTTALGDIDALGADKLQAQGGLAPADLAAIRSAGEEVAALDQRQAQAISAIQRRLDR
jgi:hypothetical protein